MHCADPGGCNLPRVSGRFVCERHLKAAHERLLEAHGATLRQELNHAGLLVGRKTDPPRRRYNPVYGPDHQAHA